jgi:hypothetical protein
MSMDFARQATRVHLPLDIAFEQILRGDMPVTTKPVFQPACETWCKKNMRGHYDAVEVSPKIYASGMDIVDGSFAYLVWFEFVEDATLFKLRWF